MGFDIYKVPEATDPEEESSKPVRSISLKQVRT